MTYLRVLFQIELLPKATSCNLKVTLIEFEDLNFLRNGRRSQSTETNPTSLKKKRKKTHTRNEVWFSGKIEQKFVHHLVQEGQ